MSAGRRGSCARRRTSGSGRRARPIQTHGDVIDVILKELGRQAGRDRLQGRARRADLRRGAGDRRGDRDDGAVRRRRPGPQPALHRGDEGVSRRSCRTCRRWRRSRRRFTRRSRCPGRSTRSRTSGPRSSASADTASTARRIATSRRACANWSARRPGGSSVATWADRARSARSRTARSSPTPSA